MIHWTHDRDFWLILLTVLGFIAGTAWGWLLRMAYVKPIGKESENVRESSSSFL